MKKLKLDKMTRPEKIKLLERIKSREVHVISGQLIDSGVVLIEKNGTFLLNGSPVDLELIQQAAETVIILPDNNR